MATPAPGLPTRFPCWCRAIYSWGGETKRDLGFIEGDLIECLNAGDGSWWTGRLYRDKRSIGVFPSNFVRVLDDSFQPTSRAVSPLPPSRNGSYAEREDTSQRADSRRQNDIRAHSPQPQKSPSKTFRRPFQAYINTATPSSTASGQKEHSNARRSSPRPYGSYRAPSRNSHQARPRGDEYSFSPSPSPQPSVRHFNSSRGPSPSPTADGGSSPPPPPPPHRVMYGAQSGTYSGHQTPSRQPSPAPGASSPGGTGMTPSPLRDAMEDVMSSLHDMGASQEQERHSPSRAAQDPWSPEAFEIPYTQTPSRRKARPRSSLGIGQEEEKIDDHSLSRNNSIQAIDGPPQVSNYVQRMESRLRRMQGEDNGNFGSQRRSHTEMPPPVPPKNPSYSSRPQSSLERNSAVSGSNSSQRKLRNRKSAIELGKGMLNRTFTIKSNGTNTSSEAHSTSTGGSNSTQITSASLMSGHSAGKFSATSAGSFARRQAGMSARPKSVMEISHNDLLGAEEQSRTSNDLRPRTPLTGITYHSSHDTEAQISHQSDWTNHVSQSAGALGGLTMPRHRKSGFFKKILESAKTGAASARSSIAAAQNVQPQSPPKSMLPSGVTAISSGNGPSSMHSRSNSGGDWVQVRRDVNRSNSLSKNERVERQERCQMMDFPVLNPVDILLDSTAGDEGADGHPVEEAENFQLANLNLVDKSARFVNSLPPTINAAGLAQGYVCRPYRSEAQRLRAIFTWVSEKVAWEEDFEGDIDSRRVIHSMRGCAEEVAVLVMEMCHAIGIHAEVVRGYLKTPGEQLDIDSLPRPNHWWNNVIVESQWRMIDCSLASPTNPRRSMYSSTSTQMAESWFFLTRPSEICYTHVPLAPEQQHICPAVSHDVLLALPCACAPYFSNQMQLEEYDTSLVRIEELEQVHLHINVASDVECVAEVEAKAFARDADGDFFESGDVVRKRGLAQADWVGGQKRYTIKALLPGDEGQGVLKVYAGKRGLMHSIKDNPHPLALAIPILHAGRNPPYEFLTRHPTPHAQRHDLYVVQPQCARLAMNNTFVFAVRQHPSSLSSGSGARGQSGISFSSATPGNTSPMPFTRPSSAMSMSTTSFSASGSGSGTAVGSGVGGIANASAGSAQHKPAKLAIQAPSGKILRLMRKSDHTISTSGPGGGEAGDGGVWETIIKCGERGVWRGLVLADRSARWCVFAEWNCV